LWCCEVSDDNDDELDLSSLWWNIGVENWKVQTLPLARIKKIMKSEEFVLQELEKERQQMLVGEEDTAGFVDTEKPQIKFMISGEAPVLMSKACELLIKDLSFRAWRHTERNRRRTLQRQDLHAAVGESEVYDFLIDIVPRVTSAPSPKVHHPPPSHIPSVVGFGGVSHAGMAVAGLPHGMHMQMHAGVPSGVSTASSLSHGIVATAHDDSGNGMMQHMDLHQLGQPTHSQQQAYQYDTSHHTTNTQSQHMTQQTQLIHHDQQHGLHQQAMSRGMQQQQEGTAEGTSTLPPQHQDNADNHLLIRQDFGFDS
jgi:histone H3/H4